MSPSVAAPPPADYRPLDLAGVCNHAGEVPGASAPTGNLTFRGLPFRLGNPDWPLLLDARSASAGAGLGPSVPGPRSDRRTAVSLRSQGSRDGGAGLDKGLNLLSFASYRQYAFTGMLLARALVVAGRHEAAHRTR